MSNLSYRTNYSEIFLVMFVQKFSVNQCRDPTYTSFHWKAHVQNSPDILISVQRILLHALDEPNTRLISQYFYACYFQITWRCLFFSSRLIHSFILLTFAFNTGNWTPYQGIAPLLNLALLLPVHVMLQR